MIRSAQAYKGFTPLFAYIIAFTKVCLASSLICSRVARTQAEPMMGQLLMSSMPFSPQYVTMRFVNSTPSIPALAGSGLSCSSCLPQAPVTTTSRAVPPFSWLNPTSTVGEIFASQLVINGMEKLIAFNYCGNDDKNSSLEWGATAWTSMLLQKQDSSQLRSFKVWVSSNKSCAKRLGCLEMNSICQAYVA